MSTGTRLPLAWAQEAAKALMVTWGMSGGACMVVGSVRREKDDVGDLEMIAPLPEPGQPDTLYDTIERTLETPGLFGAKTVPVARAVRGVRSGFKAAELLADVTKTDTGEGFTIPVAIYRYRPENRGWIELMRTGPGDFGKWFLGMWKRAQNIPEGSQASIEGCLCDRWGKPMHTLTEAACFKLCGIAYLEPRDRERFVRDVTRTREGPRR